MGEDRVGREEALPKGRDGFLLDHRFCPFPNTDLEWAQTAFLRRGPALLGLHLSG